MLGSGTGPTDKLTYETAGQLTYCAAVINEATRLYPPAPLTVRSLEKPLELEGKTLPAGTMCYVPIWWVHRSVMNWGDDAESFRPERHLEEEGGEAAKSASSFRHVAFSGGQRNCVGQRFAVLESVVLFALVVRSVRLTLAPGSEEVAVVSTGVVQKPKNGELWMNVAAR